MGILSKLTSLVTGAPAEAVVGYFNKRQELKQQLSLARLEGEIAVEKARAEYRVKDLEYDNA